MTYEIPYLEQNFFAVRNKELSARAVILAMPIGIKESLTYALAARDLYIPTNRAILVKPISGRP